MHRTISRLHSDNDDLKIREGKKILQGLSALKYELQHNKPWQAIVEDGLDDLASFNERHDVKSTPRWMELPYMYAEIYMYRYCDLIACVGDADNMRSRIQNLFAISRSLKIYDPFERTKWQMLEEAYLVMTDYAVEHHETISELEDQDLPPHSKGRAATEWYHFRRSCNIALGGEFARAYLYPSSEDTSKTTARQNEPDTSILADKAEAAIRVLAQARESARSERIIHIVVGTAGFDLFADLILASTLLQFDLATKVMIHTKAFPFGIETTTDDIERLIHYIALSSERAETGESGRIAMLSLYDHIEHLRHQGKIVVRSHTAWTSPLTGRDFVTVYPELVDGLRAAELVIVKGDFVYRKFLGDVSAPSRHFSSSPPLIRPYFKPSLRL